MSSSSLLPSMSVRPPRSLDRDGVLHRGRRRSRGPDMVPHPLRNLVRAVAVEDLCPETLVSEFFLHLGKRLGGRFAHHRLGGDRVELLAHKVVLRSVTGVEADTEDLGYRRPLSAALRVASTRLRRRPGGRGPYPLRP